jgi:hypothetical protein
MEIAKQVVCKNELELSLTKLAGQINAEHASFESALRKGLEHARNAGELLVEARRQIPHGRWLSWLNTHCPGVTARTAQRYMRVASRWDELVVKCDTVSHLTFNQAVRLLTNESQDSTPLIDEVPKDEAADDTSTFTIYVDYKEYRHKYHKCFLDSPPGSYAEYCHLWWDIEAGYTLLLNVGLKWDAERIAEFLGADPREVRLILNPTPPVRFDSPRTGSEIVAAFADPKEFILAYEEEVQGRIHGILWALLFRIYEVDPRIAAAAAELRDRAPRFKELADKQKYALDRLHMLTPEEIGTAGCCVLTDARAALGIEPPKEDFAEMWNKYHSLD